MRFRDGPPNSMKIVAIQYDIDWNAPQKNFTQLRTLIARAVSDGAEFVILPEMFSTGFIVDSTDHFEPSNGPSVNFLCEMATTHGIWITGTCTELCDDDPRPYNSLVVVSPAQNIFRYRKIHPFTYGGEDRIYRAGTSFMTVPIGDLRVSFFVCYDLRFADEFWALAQDTDLYVVPANWPHSRREHWLTLLRARAIENQAYIVGCNRVGEGGGLTYVGDSIIIDPLGHVLNQAAAQTCTITADVSHNVVHEARARYPFLRDRR